MILPGDIVSRLPFLSYTYRYDDVDYSEGMPDLSPLLHDDPTITSVNWPISRLGIVIYVANHEAHTCLLMVDRVGIVWAPRSNLRQYRVV